MFVFFCILFSFNLLWCDVLVEEEFFLDDLLDEWLEFVDLEFLWFFLNIGFKILLGVEMKLLLV